MDQQTCKYWICEMDEDFDSWIRWTCPNCGYMKRTDIHVSIGWNYCPMCGVNLSGRKEEKADG